MKLFFARFRVFVMAVSGWITLQTTGTSQEPEIQQIYVWGEDKWGLQNPPPPDNYVAIDAGENHALALTADGRIEQWGISLDDARFGWTSFPEPTGSNFIAISAGTRHNLALREGGFIEAWGIEQDVDGRRVISDTPFGGGFIAVSAGNKKSAALHADGYIVEWPSIEFDPRPPPSESNFEGVSLGDGHGIALNTGDSLVGWGLIRLPEGSGHQNAADAIPEPNSNFKQISAGSGFVAALKNDGSVLSWGRVFLSGESYIPEGNDFKAVAAGWGHFLALREDGTIEELGATKDSAFSGTPIPENVEYNQITAGEQFSVALGPPQEPPPPQIRILYPRPGEIICNIGSIVQSTVRLTGDLSSIQTITFTNLLPDSLSDLYDIPVQSVDISDNNQEPISRVFDQMIYHDEVLEDGVLTNTFVAKALNSEDQVVVEHRVPFLVGCSGGIEHCFYQMLLALFRGEGSSNSQSSLSSSDALLQHAESQVNHESNEDLLRSFRDTTLASTQPGQFYTKLYETLSASMILAVAQDRQLVNDINDTIIDWIPAIEAILAGEGITFIITEEMAIDAQNLLERMYQLASEELRLFMDTETVTLDPSSWAGISMQDLLDRVESRRLPNDTTELDILHRNRDIFVEWWSQTDGLYRVLRSENNLDSFIPVENWRPGNDHFQVYEERLSGDEPVFYQLEYQEP